MNWYKKANKLTDEEFEEITKPKWIKVDSSFIDSIAYCEGLEILDILMKDGREYSFKDVPISIYNNFINSKSKGMFFNEFIRNYDQE